MKKIFNFILNSIAAFFFLFVFVLITDTVFSFEKTYKDNNWESIVENKIIIPTKEKIKPIEKAIVKKDKTIIKKEKLIVKKDILKNYSEKILLKSHIILYPGEHLFIKSKKYKIKKGDYFFKIANKFNLTGMELLRKNEWLIKEDRIKL